MGVANGYGRQIYPSGTYYHGYFQDGLRHGVGRCVYERGTVKDGLWQKNNFVEEIVDCNSRSTFNLHPTNENLSYATQDIKDYS